MIVSSIFSSRDQTRATAMRVHGADRFAISSSASRGCRERYLRALVEYLAPRPAFAARCAHHGKDACQGAGARASSVRLTWRNICGPTVWPWQPCLESLGTARAAPFIRRRERVGGWQLNLRPFGHLVDNMAKAISISNRYGSMELRHERLRFRPGGNLPALRG